MRGLAEERAKGRAEGAALRGWRLRRGLQRVAEASGFEQSRLQELLQVTVQELPEARASKVSQEHRDREVGRGEEAEQALGVFGLVSTVWREVHQPSLRRAGVEGGFRARLVAGSPGILMRVRVPGACDGSTFHDRPTLWSQSLAARHQLR